MQTIRVVRPLGVARSADKLQRGNTLIDVRQRRKREVRFGLIPIGYRIKVVRAMIGVPMLDAGPHRLGEWYRRVEVKAVHAETLSRQVPADDGRAVKQKVLRTHEPPCAEKIVFAAGANDGRRVAINLEHVVAFAKPAVLVLQ